MNLNNIQFDYNSKVILSYFFISLFACFLNFITKSKSNKLLFMSYRNSIFSPLTYIRLFTHSIGHKNLNHLINNFLIILLVGGMIEEKYGSINLLIMFLITSLIIGLYNIIFHNNCILGSSGNVYMLIVLSSFSNITEGKIPLTLILILIFYVTSQVKKSILENDHISYNSHIIGALCGIIFGYLLYNYQSFSNIFSLINK